MQEIRILELFIGILVFVPLIRPFVKELQSLDGLTLFPVFALASIVALFPVYGFRPECLPLLLMVIILNIHAVPGLVAMVKRERQDTVLCFGPIHTVILFCLSGIALGTALMFAPAIPAALRTEGITTVTVKHEARNAEFFLRIYGPSTGSENRPLMMVVPPILGSVAAIDTVCTALEAQGFTVITYSRRNFDVPAVGEGGKTYGVSPGTLIRVIRAFGMGTAFEGANGFGRTFEGERTEDILFLLAYIRESLELPSTDKNTVFLTGYDFGGSAVVFIGESAELLKSNPQLKGFIAVESPLLSVYQVERRPPPDPPEEAVQWFRNLWSGIAEKVLDLIPKRMSGLERVPRTEAPTLFLVSDKISDPRSRDGRYRPVVRTLQSSLAALVTVPGAGPLNYSDYPAKYPLYGAIYSGSQPGGLKNAEWIEATAWLITRFAELAVSEYQGAPRPQFLEKIHFEAGKLWNLPSFGSILFP
ncbi:MAG: hypothetical protein LBG73_05535 [Spirochaetaceae bacterium]|jgi:dienelactone hydrolase|nr:hypothetical protein [Spirochaetaceae bacterium]